MLVLAKLLLRPFEKKISQCPAVFDYFQCPNVRKEAYRKASQIEVSNISLWNEF